MASHAQSARVLSVSIHQSFIDECAAHLLQQHGEEGLHHHIVFVPNQRTGRAFREALATKANNGAVLLPHIIAAQHNSTATMLNLFTGNEAAIQAFLTIPPAMEEGTRISLITKLVQASHPMVEQFAHLPKALGLARDLAALHDDLILHRSSAEAIRETFGKTSIHHYGDALAKLFAIITDHWPAIAREYGAISAAQHQAQLQAAFTEHMGALPAHRHIYVIGSTGSVPAMRELMQAVANHPTGRVIIPGAGANAPTPEALLHVNHTLDALHASAADVAILGENSASQPTPAAAYNAATSEEEARLITLLIRKTLATSTENCLLITPDASLMKRVGAHLNQAGITPNAPPLSLLLYTPAMQALLAACTLISQPGSHYLERALMEHFIARDDAHAKTLQDGITLLDKHALRNPRDRSFNALENASDDLRAMTAEIRALMQKLGKLRSTLHTAGDWEAAIRTACGACRYIALPELPESVLAGLHALAPLGSIDAADMVHVLHDMGSKPVSIPTMADNRVHLLTPIEARLVKADHVIFASFHAGYWPRITEQNAWLGTRQRNQLGLITPEDEFALAAHDVWLHASSATRISYSYATNDSGTLTQASPLQPMLAQAPADADVLAALALAYAPDHIAPEMPAEPNPPVHARPRHLRISALDTLLKDPYSMYAQYILGLEPLDTYDTKAGNREFGTLAHSLIQKIVSGELNLGTFNEWTTSQIIRYALSEGESLFWQRRLTVIAAFADALKTDLQAHDTPFTLEETLTAAIEINGHTFTLDGRADMIAHDAREGASITDFKTGTAFTVSDMRDGKTAQLLGYALLLELRGIEARIWRCMELPRIHKPEKQHELSISAEDFNMRKTALRNSLQQAFFEQTPLLSHPLYEEGVDTRRDEFDDVSRIEEWG